MELYKVLSIWVWVDLGVMTRKEYSTFPRAPGLELLYLMLSYLEHLFVLTHLQRSSWCILQSWLSETGKFLKYSISEATTYAKYGKGAYPCVISKLFIGIQMSSTDLHISAVKTPGHELCLRLISVKCSCKRKTEFEPAVLDRKVDFLSNLDSNEEVG